MKDKLNQFQADAEKLLTSAATMYPSLPDGDLPDGVNAKAWKRYQVILQGFMAASDAGGWNATEIKYDKMPSLTDNYAAVTVKAKGSCLFTPTAKTALALAAATVDRVSVTMDSDKLWLNFVITNLWENGGIE